MRMHCCGCLSDWDRCVVSGFHAPTLPSRMMTNSVRQLLKNENSTSEQFSQWSCRQGVAGKLFSLNATLHVYNSIKVLNLKYLDLSDTLSPLLITPFLGYLHTQPLLPATHSPCLTYPAYIQNTHSLLETYADSETLLHWMNSVIHTVFVHPIQCSMQHVCLAAQTCRKGHPANVTSTYFTIPISSLVTVLICQC